MIRSVCALNILGTAKIPGDKKMCYTVCTHLLWGAFLQVRLWGMFYSTIIYPNNSQMRK
jgi:hypothetical protein